jgi:hypothetical protein
MLLPDDESVTRFLVEYGDIDPDLLARTRGWAVRNGLMILDIGLAGRDGRPGGKPTWERPGRRAIERALQR